MKLRDWQTNRPKIALVCRSGQENLIYSAQVAATFRKGLRLNGLDISGIYAVSGSCPTALLGCINREDELCGILADLTPKEITGYDPRGFAGRAKLFSNLRYGYAFSGKHLLRLIQKHCLPHMDEIFGPEAILMKIGAVDYLTSKSVVFSNKIPEHREDLCGGVVGSMCLVPWFESFTIGDYDLEDKKLPEAHPEFGGLFLIDGAYKAGIMLEEALGESIGYDIIVIVDIYGLEDEEIAGDPDPKNPAVRIERAMSVINTANDRRILSEAERINEEIAVRDKLLEIKNSPECPMRIRWEIINLLEEMEKGRLGLRNKRAPQIIKISDPKRTIPFSFTDFSREDVAHIMDVGHDSALDTLKELGLDTAGIPVTRP